MLNKQKAVQEICDYLNSLGPEPHPETLAGQVMPPAQAEWSQKMGEGHDMALKAGVDKLYVYDETLGKWVPNRK